VAGTSAHRVDGIEKVTGKAVYTTDLQLPGMRTRASSGVRWRTRSSSKSRLPKRKRFRE
jgi:CO/xanthine dehydrogenase Mo-binding subunit